MLVVHAVVLAGGRIGLWAETAEPAPRVIATHPYATAPPVVGALDTVTLRLPTDARGPLPSPELAALGGTAALASAAQRTPTGTASWSVPVIMLAPGIDPEPLLDGVGVRAGASVGGLSDLVVFAHDLVRRGRVVPAIVQEGDQPAARWRPLLIGPDEARFAALGRSLAPVAVCAEGGLDLVGQLRVLVDALVRLRVPASVTPARGGWVAGLTGRGATFEAPPAQVRLVRDALASWAASAMPGPVRTCFRLRYIDESDVALGPAGAPTTLGWRLEFLLQPAADPSILVPAGQVWTDVAGPLTGWVDDPQEVLLADLARASRLFPDLDEALRFARPAELELEVDGAYRFLSHAPLLEQAGFGVLVPAQWQRRASVGLTMTVHTRQTTTAVLRDETANLDAIVDYRWGLALGAEQLSEGELAELARAKVPLVRLRGRWVRLNHEQLRAGLAFLARGGAGQITAGEALRRVRLLPPPDQPLPVTAVDGTGWVADLLSGRLADEPTPVAAPAGLAAQLRPYQRTGLAWLAFLDRLGIGALLADDMGLGKTVQLLALEALRRADGPRPPTLIVCPLSILGNWQREIERFTPGLTVGVYHGSERELADHDLVLTTYQVAARDVDRLAAHRWDRVVLDEAQQVKNAATGTARALRQLPARHRVALTGTPVENRLADLWSIMDFLNPDLLGPANTFRNRYAVPVERYRDEEAAARLRWLIRPLVLRRRKSDRAVIADLPDKFERVQWCNLSVEQATLYRAVVDELFDKLRERGSSHRHKGLVLSAMTKLKQVCDHPAALLKDGSSLADRSGKFDRLEEILTSALAEGDRALVFTQFASLGTLLQPYLRERLGVDIAFLHGGTARGARDALVQRFQAESGPPVLLLSLKAGGTGLNLTAANHVIHLDRWWNPATEAQATDRAFRIGQTRDVQVHTLVCLGTIEERIDQMIADKKLVAQMTVERDEGWLGGLSTADLHRLVALRDD